jgi:hypothetical protein
LRVKAPWCQTWPPQAKVNACSPQEHNTLYLLPRLEILALPEFIPQSLKLAASISAKGRAAMTVEPQQNFHVQVFEHVIILRQPDRLMGRKSINYFAHIKASVPHIAPVGNIFMADIHSKDRGLYLTLAGSIKSTKAALGSAMALPRFEYRPTDRPTNLCGRKQNIKKDPSLVDCLLS